MKEYTETQLNEKHDEFIKTLEKYFSGQRLKQLKHFYTETEYAARLVTAPASGKAHYHNAYIGGYIDHINNVIYNSLGIKKLYEVQGVVFDFELEELIFAAMHHDLYKLGTNEFEFYVPETSDWHIKNQGSLFKVNSKIPYTDGADMTFYILQQNGITYSHTEMLGIKLADGMYNDDNVKYLKTFEADKSLRTLLPAIIHSADYISLNVERNQWRQSKS